MWGKLSWGSVDIHSKEQNTNKNRLSGQHWEDRSPYKGWEDEEKNEETKIWESAETKNIDDELNKVRKRWI